MVELLEGIGHNIRRLREEKGWNQTELGFHADTSPSIISLIENAKRNPSTATLAKIARALGVEVVELFPKASSRSSREPSLFNGLEGERRPSVFAQLLNNLAARLEHAKPPESLADISRTFGVLDTIYGIAEPLLELTDDRETWEHQFSVEERLEILSVGTRLHETGKQLLEPINEYLDRRREGIEDRAAQRQAEHLREQVREWTRRISA